ncbi:MAG: 16S rRNA (uracil(1498)-N(3))-methyltransferase [Flexistipes sinusarabici]|uniref:Ribosomal RNA small subunit methyltransferase E n=1 Tax=Flexistipes sinusarabici TaxID=2352 RepID=A0A5D0MNG6_FLESI|nr:RsmE family RNA methyltransferase [Flexistipes sinusarabici]TYB33485.1 MAG: 16S rRNA (uracil(1498)-N(3))-methyltransferase [Flexistipes sinusarabici]
MQGLKRFYYNLPFSDELAIGGEVFNHLKNVLRCSAGEEILVYNDKSIARYRINSVNKRRISAHLLEKKMQINPDFMLHVYLAVMKNRYMDNIIQKLGEIGITRLIPVYTENSTARVNDKTYSRYKDLLIKGALQAELDFLPVLENTIDIDQINPECETNLLFAARRAETEIPLIKSKSVSLLVGPEGGYTEREMKFLSGKGFLTISPVSSVLKAETAAVVFTGMVKILMENICV